jgi:RNA 2',3'-cyclic 3'-phosphodiesterase
LIRLFVAIDLPQAVRDRLAGMGGGVPNARWVPPENMHLTLRFIGEVENGLAQDIDTALTKLYAPGFDIELHGVGFFGKASAARLLWARVRRSEPLLRLQTKVEAALWDAGMPAEERKFSPHVTLARMRRAPADRLQHFVADHAAFLSGPIPVDHITLYSSFRSGSGPVYQAEAEYSLDPPG